MDVIDFEVSKNMEEQLTIFVLIIMRLLGGIYKNML